VADALVERRRAGRASGVEAHGIVCARVRPGHDASIVDVSAAGALVETRHRLLPGSSIELYLQTPDQRASVRGRVVRCAVSHLHPSSLSYRGALEFDRQVAWLNYGEVRLPPPR
jgi:hypothetical protein